MASEETRELLASAEAFAAGKTLGLSEEEVLSAISRQARADMRQYQPAGYLGSGLTQEEVTNDLIRRSNQRAAQLGTVPDVIGPATADLSAPNPVDENQTLRPGDRAFVGPGEQSSREEREGAMGKIRSERRDRYEKARKKKGLRVFKNQPTSLTRVYGADVGGEDKPGVSEFGGPSSIPTQGMSSGDQRKEREAMTALSRELRSRENARMSNPDMQAASYLRAMSDARDVLLEGNVGPDINIPNSATYPQAVMEDFGPFGKVYVDPTSGQAITPIDYAIAGSNTPDSGQMLNAPQGATEFVTKQVFEGGPYSRDQGMPAVDIGAELAGLDDAVARLGQSQSFQGLQLESDKIRTFDALEKAASAIKAVAAQTNTPMIRVDPETGKRVSIPASEAGMDEVFTAMKIGPAQKERIAVALAQLGAAGQTSAYTAKPTGSRGVTLERAQGPTVSGTPGYYVSSPAPSTPDVVSLERPGRSALLSGGKMVEAAVPIKRMPSGGKNPLIKILQEAGRRGEISEEAASPFFGAMEGERAAPTIRAVGSPSDIAAATRVERLERDLGKGSVARAVAALRERGNPQPSFEDAMNLLEGTYQSRLGKGKVAKKNVIDESEIARTIARRQGVASRGEDAAMGRLLSGPLKPGPDPTEAQASPPVSAAPVAAEVRRRRMGRVSPSAMAYGGSVVGGGLLASLLLNSGGES